MKYEVTLGDRTVAVDVTAANGGWSVSVDGGEPRLVTGRQVDGTRWRLDAGDGLKRMLGIALTGDMAFVLDGDTPLRGEVVDPRARALDMAGGGAQGRIVSQMPGAVVRVLVAPGDEVAEGQVLCVVEAMKMENEFKAPFAATVSSVDVQAGQAIEGGATLLVLEPLDGGPDVAGSPAANRAH